ncbi:MAG: bifunctional UDP-N-acetylglucosamine diphosphorylase/glucosamine-1-phosphate N-acetyltransferase GlmU [Acidobacteria bacterium]|nr:bifunctional UDP-N-acetylglucosamine diphosphorylase/glucosamine-1-phosphate N-acetyltransferase GlmU [Acidobacteriota bacterium]
MSDLHIVLLAAGKGTRMKSATPKVLHNVAGLPMIDRVLASASQLNPASTTVVTGHLAEALEQRLAGRGLRFVRQEPQLGTGHALLQTDPLFQEATGTIVLLSGDVPLLTSHSLQQLVLIHRERNAAATVMTARIDRPFGYGRIIRSRGAIARIVEERDASPAERAIQEVNAGIYALEIEPLFKAMRSIAAQNAQGEYYLPDLVGVYRRQKRRVETFELDNPNEIRGINSRTELSDVTRIVRQSKNEELMAAGVTIIDPATTYIDDSVTVGADTVIHPQVFLEGRTTIGAACEIHASVRIVDSVLADRVVVQNFCVITESRLETGARVGPFAHLRPGAVLSERAKVGNFVELKKTTMGRNAKANHLTYLGDATVGNDVNVGAGTITCNYDGVQKHPTIIEDGAFIGSDTQLIAPVRVGQGAYVAAGSSITDDVPPGSLGIARGRQTNVEGWVARNKSRHAKGEG